MAIEFINLSKTVSCYFEAKALYKCINKELSKSNGPFETLCMSCGTQIMVRIIFAAMMFITAEWAAFNKDHCAIAHDYVVARPCEYIKVDRKGLLFVESFQCLEPWWRKHCKTNVLPKVHLWCHKSSHLPCYSDANFTNICLAKTGEWWYVTQLGLYKVVYMCHVAQFRIASSCYLP